MRGVLITGVGAHTARARDVDDLWQQASQGSTRGPGPKKGPGPFVSAEAAAVEALTQARIWDGHQLADVDPERVGSTFSASKPLFCRDGALVEAPDVLHTRVSRRFGMQGESHNVVAACATGSYAVALGASWIEQGLCDIVLAGSAEAPAHPLIEAGFRRMGVISREETMRPFDRRRSGFVLASGAGAVVLESRANAERRGVRPLARLAGWGWGADAHSAVAFNSNGERIAVVIRQALRRAGLRPDEIDHVNAHGTATPLNDRIETQALIKAFGVHADRLMISATKSTTGHLLGAAGSVELILTIQALSHQFIPPTAHLDQPDPECCLNYTAGQGHAANFDQALSLSFGFGGPIGALIVGRV